MLIVSDLQAGVSCQLRSGLELSRRIQRHVVANMTVVDALAPGANVGKRRQQPLGQALVSLLTGRCTELPFKGATQRMVGLDLRIFMAAMPVKQALGFFEKRVETCKLLRRHL